MPSEEIRDRRLELQEIFCNILGSNEVYFQPPNNIKMNYPAIVYKLADIKQVYADDGVYSSRTRYMVTYITDEPESDIVLKLAHIPLTRFVRHYTEDNLYHYVYELY